jgi:hypothetical protein
MGEKRKVTIPMQKTGKKGEGKNTGTSPMSKVRGES